MAKLPSGLPDQVSDHEDLARFLTSSGHYNSVGAKPSAFLPNPTYKNTSVFREGGNREVLLKIWLEQNKDGMARKLHGAAIFKALHVREAALDAQADEPPERHANIVNWTWMDDPEMQKAKQKNMAQIIASKAEVVRL